MGRSILDLSARTAGEQSVKLDCFYDHEVDYEHGLGVDFIITICSDDVLHKCKLFRPVYITERVNSVVRAKHGVVPHSNQTGAFFGVSYCLQAHTRYSHPS